VPVCVRKRKGKYRVVECDTGRLVRPKDGAKPTDGGGHESKQKAKRQAGYINDEG
jgi:hypothetical protein